MRVPERISTRAYPFRDGNTGFVCVVLISTFTMWNLEITSPNNIKWYPWKDKHACLSFQGFLVLLLGDVISSHNLIINDVTQQTLESNSSSINDILNTAGIFLTLLRFHIVCCRLLSSYDVSHKAVVIISSIIIKLLNDRWNNNNCFSAI